MQPCWLQKRGPEGYPIGFWGSFSRFLRLLAVLVALGECWGPFCTALGRKRWPTWLQVGLQNRANIDETSVEKSIQNLMRLGIDFSVDFGGFWGENGPKLAPKSHPTCGFLKIRKMPFGASPLAPNQVRGVQVGSQNRSKIDRNLKSKIERLLASIFRGFWRVWGGKLGGKIEPWSTKNRCQKSIEKMMEKIRKCSVHGGGDLWTRERTAGILGPPTWQFSKTTTPQRRAQQTH